MIYDQHKKREETYCTRTRIHVKCFVTYQGESIPAQVTRTNKCKIRIPVSSQSTLMVALMVYLALSSPQYCLFQEQNEK